MRSAANNRADYAVTKPRKYHCARVLNRTCPSGSLRVAETSKSGHGSTDMNHVTRNCKYSYAGVNHPLDAQYLGGVAVKGDAVD